MKRLSIGPQIKSFHSGYWDQIYELWVSNRTVPSLGPTNLVIFKCRLYLKCRASTKDVVAGSSGSGRAWCPVKLTTWRKSEVKETEHLVQTLVF